MMKSISPLIRELYNSNDFNDITLMVENETYRCHKFVIATYDPFLAEILHTVDFEDEVVIHMIDSKKVDVENFINNAYGVSDVRDVSNEKLDTSDELREIQFKDEEDNFDHMDSDLNETFESIDCEEDAEELYDPVKNKCQICGKFTKNVRRHIASNHTEKLSEYDKVTKDRRPRKYPKKCEFCSRIVMDSYKYRRHLKSHKELTEDVIEKVLGINQGDTQRKVNEISKKSEYPKKCEFCPQMSPDNYHYQRHRKVCKFWVKTGSDDSTLPFFCEECGKHFGTSKALKSHQNDHKNEFRCDVDSCQESFRSSTLHRKHLMYSHGIILNKPKKEEKDKELCTLCGKYFVDLKQHVRVIHDEKENERVLCNICGKDLKKISLPNHMKIEHSGIKIECPSCDKTFNSRMAMNRHFMNLHVADSEKKWQCQICGKGFQDSKLFETHQNIHKNIKPFSCPHCNSSFTDKSNLYQHIRKTHRDLNHSQ